MSLCMFAFAHVVAMASATPMPFPLPANISFGSCGTLNPSVLPGLCSTSVTLASKVSIRCSKQCSPNCQQSALFQQVFARYEARLGGGAPSAAAQQPQPNHATQKTGQKFWWWRLNNTDCNNMDMSSWCEDMTIPQCQAKCEANPGCGGFLFYSKTGKMHLKNTSCWQGIGPLPQIDDGDDLFVMNSSPMPEPLPHNGSVVMVGS